MKDDIDFFLLREIKLDENFPNKHFEMQSYKTFCQNRNKHGGGVMLYVNENIPCRVGSGNYVIYRFLWPGNYIPEILP